MKITIKQLSITIFILILFNTGIFAQFKVNEFNTLTLLEEMEGKTLYHLNTGSYLIRFNEIVRIPKDCIGLILPRSSLMRMGASIEGAVWEPGYEGRGVCLLTVHNPMGIVVEQGARIVQLVLIRTTSETEGYHGRYMGEGIEEGESRST